MWIYSLSSTPYLSSEVNNSLFFTCLVSYVSITMLFLWQKYKSFLSASLMRESVKFWFFFIWGHFFSLSYSGSESQHLLSNSVWCMKFRGSFTNFLGIVFALLLYSVPYFLQCLVLFLSLIGAYHPHNCWEGGHGKWTESTLCPHINNGLAFWWQFSGLMGSLMLCSLAFKCCEWHLIIRGKYFENLRVWQ